MSQSQREQQQGHQQLHQQQAASPHVISIRQKERGPWACPDDRELALRARLRSGWSIKTDHTFRMPEPLTDKERSTILEVVQKADRIEQMEQERIIRLVTQIEKMRHCCVLGGGGSGQCHMCGSPFRLLLSTAQRCNVCAWDVCSKCGLNVVVLQSGSMQRDVVWLCKICHETREVWKKTGAWFYKGLPSYALEAIERERTARLTAQNLTRNHAHPVQVIRYRDRYRNQSEPSTPGLTPAASHSDIKRTVYISDSDDSSDDSLGESARRVVERETAGGSGQTERTSGASGGARQAESTIFNRSATSSPLPSAVGAGRRYITPPTNSTRTCGSMARDQTGNMNFGSLAEQVIEAGLTNATNHSNRMTTGAGHKRALHSTNSTGSSTSTGTNSEPLSAPAGGSMSKSAMSIDSLAQALDSAAALTASGSSGGIIIQPCSPSELQQGNEGHKKAKSSIYKRIRKSFRNATLSHALSFNEKRRSQPSPPAPHHLEAASAAPSSTVDHSLLKTPTASANGRRSSTTDDLKYSEL